MFQAVDRSKLETETYFTSMHHLYDMFAFLDPHALLKRKSRNAFTNALKRIYDNVVDLSKLVAKIDKFKRLLRSDTTFDRNATAFDVLQWLV